jgi:hypothetical protein
MRQSERPARQESTQIIASGCDNKNATVSSYEASLLTTKTRNSHKVAKELLQPAAKAVTSRIPGDTAAINYNFISFHSLQSGEFKTWLKMLKTR